MVTSSDEVALGEETLCVSRTHLMSSLVQEARLQEGSGAECWTRGPKVDYQ